MKLLILFGPPAVGKTTVGKIIEEKSDFKLFHNHMIMDGVMQLFGVGTPIEDKLSREFRTRIIEEAAENGFNLIFTYVWNFDKEKGKINIDRYKSIYESRGGSVIFAELSAPLITRIERAKSLQRKEIKAHAPDSERVGRLEKTHNFTPPSAFYYPNLHKKFETDNKTPEQIATEVITFIGTFS
ncbi:MAG: shikimate kinase [Candidatus Taylorbacteria bacterium]